MRQESARWRYASVRMPNLSWKAPYTCAAIWLISALVGATKTTMPSLNSSRITFSMQ